MCMLYKQTQKKYEATGMLAANDDPFCVLMKKEVMGNLFLMDLLNLHSGDDEN